MLRIVVILLLILVALAVTLSVYFFGKEILTINMAQDKGHKALDQKVRQGVLT